MPKPLKIEHVAPDSLKPAEYNPRTITDEAHKRLTRGIIEFGLVDPIIARRSDRMVIGGHQRLAAAQHLGMTAVPVVFLDDIDDQRAAALNVMLNNQNAAGDWDYPKLTALLSSLDGEGFDATLSGFSEVELGGLLGSFDANPSKAKEINVDEFKLEHTCPRCGMEFNT